MYRKTPLWDFDFSYPDARYSKPKRRSAFANRQDSGTSWNDTIDKGGIVVSNIIEISIDAEAILEG